MKIELDNRKKKILTAVIKDYVVTAEPVGSKTLVEKYDLKISPATVRNELARLEDLGYLKQPHTSAGRIPSDLGYRFFVDSIAENEPLPAEERLTISHFFSSIDYEIEELVKETSSILTKLTNYVSLVFSPALTFDKLKHLDLILLHKRSVMLVAITKSGMVAKKVIDLVVDNDYANISRYQSILNEKLVSLKTSEIKDVAFLEVQDEKDRENLLHIVKSLFELMVDHDLERVYHDGTLELLSQPEFESLNRVQKLVSTIEKNFEVLEILTEAANEYQPVVRIGKENSTQEMDGCSLIATSYKVEGEPLGALGIIGPTRMDYQRSISAVQYIADRLSNFLENVHLRG